MSGNSSSGQFPFSGGAAVILLTLGVFIIADNPFQPTRPDVTNNLTTNTENVRARLWQDPFEAVELHRKEQHNHASGDNDSFNVESHEHVKCYIGSEDEIEKIRSELESNVELNSNIEIRPGPDFEPKIKNKTKNPALVTSTHDFDELLCQLQQKIKPAAKEESKFYDLHIIAVMVTGGPYAEDKELRIRSRYAVTTGLMSAGYNPVDSEHIGYMDLAKLCHDETKKNAGSEHSEHCDWPAVIPNEQFKLSNDAKKWSDSRFAENILVLWIDDEAISKEKPLNMLAKLKTIFTWDKTGKNILLINEQEQIKGQEKIIHDSKLKIKFDVIGPASSTTLVKMHRNLDCVTGVKGVTDIKCNEIVDEYGNGKIRVFSHRATLDDGAIKQSLNNEQLHFPGFHRTIVTDSVLVDNLLCELLRRGVNPFHDEKYIVTKNDELLQIGSTQCTNYSVNALNKFGRNDYMVLVGEGDTTYSRNFKRLFKEKIQQVAVNSLNESNKSKDNIKKKLHVDWLYSFFYLRGLDGEISKNNNSFSNSKNKTQSTSEADKSKKQFRRAAGANQFDYLRRLGDQITDLAKEKSNKGTIRAIGIVGSDTYDKLLILQALRNRFPDVLFFTTDLDARMLHHEENKYARNLIVASAFGLTPNNAIYHYHGLAFRDSYQTALYNTVQKVINNSTKLLYKKCIKFHYPETGGKLKQAECISPVKIFEIGNKRAVDYSHENNTRDPVEKIEKQLEKKREKTHEIITYILISIGIFLLLFLLTSNTTRFYISFVSFVFVSVALWLQAYDFSTNTEFHAMFTGTSVWPAYIIRMLASITAITFILYAIVNLKRNTIDIISENELSEKKCMEFTDSLDISIVQLNTDAIKKYTGLLKSSLKWLFCYDYYDKTEIKEKNNQGYFTCAFISTWGYKGKENDPVHFDDLFYQYLYLSKPQYRFTRITFTSLLYIAITVAILSVSPGLPVTPFVGEVNADAGVIILASVLIPYIWLIFLVSDITRLNSQFVILLTRYNIIWSEKILKSYCEKFGLTEDISIEKLKLDMVVKRSKVVDRLICLPFIVLTLMILSRSSYFDRWYMPPQLAFIILLGAIIALSSANRLRKSAKKARNCALENLNETYSELIFKEANPLKHSRSESSNCNMKMSVSLKNMIEEIESIKTGPFAPLTQHPIVSAIAVPFGGGGGLYISDVLSKMNL